MSINRREALKNIMIASVSTIFLTSFKTQEISSLFQNGKLALNKKYLKYLAQIAETFLPISAVSEKIERPETFILKMINHSFKSSDIEMYATGLDQYIALMKESRLKVKSRDSERVLSAIKNKLSTSPIDKELAYFINTTRSLAIRNFRSSEYYMTNYNKYKLIPKKYNGCKQINTAN